MNRKQRRAGMKQTGSLPASAGRDWTKALATGDLMAKAGWHYEQRQTEAAREICKHILAREPRHLQALNMLGLILQDSGHHRLAVKEFKKAVAADDLDAACHYNLAASYQALMREDAAARHFAKAITLGLSRRNIEAFVVLNPAIAGCMRAIDEQRTVNASGDRAIGEDTLRAIARDIFLRCALTMVPLASLPLERFLTSLRATLLAKIGNQTDGDVATSAAIDPQVERLFCALAQQCFLNEHVFAASDPETRQATALCDLLLRRADRGEDIAPALLAAVGAYMPLHALPAARELAQRRWPDGAADLVRQQIVEPLQDADAEAAIPTLTPIDDGLSLQVMQQYAENPYPRWTTNPLGALAAQWRSPPPAGDGTGAIHDILIAGCGTGQHVFHVVHNFPKARVLAIDVSRPSLAYAQRKTREADLPNIEYAQADILQLRSIGRSFDLIEAVGVLHHLEDPEQGWRVLLSLLRPAGEMRLGLYSETARRTIATVRAFIAGRGYHPTVDDIRRCRQVILTEAGHPHWQDIATPRDFYSVSGCRDLLFNVMEHRFTIPRIKAFLGRQQLTFLGFDLEKSILDQFRTQFPGAAVTDLDLWTAFEAAHPQTFRQMYQFMVRRS